MANKKGGARHFAKTWIEAGIVFDLISKHEDLMKDFRTYESISSQGALDPKGILHALEFIQDVLDVAPACEVHCQPLRSAFLRLLNEKPHLNTTAHSGSVWVHQRSERVCVLLSHFRRLARQGTTGKCALNLTAVEMAKLHKTLKKVELKDAAEEALPKPLRNGDESPQPSKKKLKKQVSDVSMDSRGYPLLLKTPEAVTPEKVDTTKAGPSRLLQKRSCTGKLMGDVKVNPGLREELFGGKAKGKHSLKKPAAAVVKPSALKKPAAAVPTGAKAWLKINKTMAKKPERAYLCGTKTIGEKSRLIVEVSRAKSSKYSLIIDKIKQALEKDHLSKEEAKALKQELCKKYS